MERKRKMANEISTYIKVMNSDMGIVNRLNELFKPSDESGEVTSLSFINGMLGTNYSYNTFEGWNRETDFPTDEIWDNYVGVKWMFVHWDETNPHTIILRSANWVPIPFLERLSEELYGIKEDCFIYGTYEDEDTPMGAFLYAKGWNDIEDLEEPMGYLAGLSDNEDESVDDFRDRLREDVEELRDSMLEMYQTVLSVEEENEEI